MNVLARTAAGGAAVVTALLFAVAVYVESHRAPDQP